MNNKNVKTNRLSYLKTRSLKSKTWYLNNHKGGNTLFSTEHIFSVKQKNVSFIKSLIAKNKKRVYYTILRISLWFIFQKPFTHNISILQL